MTRWKFNPIAATIALLLSATGCTPSEPTLQELAESGDAATIQSRVDTGAAVDERKKDLWTALHHAALAGHDEIVAILIGAGADVTLRTNFENKTALHMAAEKGHAAVARLLIDAGANTTEPDHDDKTPRDLAEANGHKDIVALIDAATGSAEDEPEAPAEKED